MRPRPATPTSWASYPKEEPRVGLSLVCRGPRRCRSAKGSGTFNRKVSGSRASGPAGGPPQAARRSPSAAFDALERPGLWRPTCKGITAAVVRPGSGARLGIHIVGDDEPPAGRRCSRVAHAPRERGGGEEPLRGSAPRRLSCIRAQVLGSASTSSGTMSHLSGDAARGWLTHSVRSGKRSGKRDSYRRCFLSPRTVWPNGRKPRRSAESLPLRPSASSAACLVAFATPGLGPKRAQLPLILEAADRD